MKVTSLLTTCVAALLAVSYCTSFFSPYCAVAVAEDLDKTIPVGDVQISTPVYRPPARGFQPALGVYTYDVSWEGIPAAEVKVTVSREGGDLKIGTNVRTYRAIDLLYNLRYEGESLVSAVDFAPKHTHLFQRENSKEKTTEITFHENGEVESVRSQKGKEPEVDRFRVNNFMLDPYSTAFLARSLDWSLGEKKEFDTYNGKNRYLITLSAVDRITKRFMGEPRDVWVIVPEVKNLTKPNAVKKLRSAKIYVTADDKHEVLQLQSSVFIGSVFTRLESFEPALAPPAPTQLAENRDRIFVK